MPTDSADALITDPPYSSGGAFRGDRTSATSVKYGSGEDLADFHGDNRDQRGFVAWAHLWLGEAYRVLKPGAFVALFTDWRQLPTMTDVLQAAGFTWRGVFVWHKPSARPTSGRPTNACEYVVWGSLGPMGMKGSTHPGLVKAVPPYKRRHQTEKPQEVLQALVRVVPVRGLILDPFAGSGSLGVACLQENREYLGCELSDHYAGVAKKRLADMTPQPSLFEASS